MSDDIIHEINEDLRQQKLQAFWKENGPWIIGGAIAAVVFTAALSWWRGHEAALNAAATAALTETVAKADPAALDALAQETRRNHALLAKFAKAQLLLSRGEKEKAAAVYDGIADGHGNGLLRDLAKLYAVTARLDTGDIEKLRKDLADISGKKDPWRFSARELEALLYAREGKTAEAGRALKDLAADPEAPADIKNRAGTLAAVYAGNG